MRGKREKSERMGVDAGVKGEKERVWEHARLFEKSVVMRDEVTYKDATSI